MKKNIIIAGALFAFLLVSCSDEMNTGGQMPVSGEEVAFGTQLENFKEQSTGSRTIYGVPDGSTVEDYEKLTISWKENDQVRVYCPQAAEGFRWADYKIASTGGDASKYYLTKENATGVRWGQTNDKHQFYAFYPTNVGRGPKYTPIDGLESNTTVKATIPVAQEKGEFFTWENQPGNVVLPQGWKLIRPDMTYAMMAGYGEWNPSDGDDNVTLNFKPLVTVVDVVVNGPKEGEADIDVYYVSIRSKTQPIVGDFTCTIGDNGDVSFSGMPEKVNADNNIATINCQYEDENKIPTPVKLHPGEKLTLKFFLLPQDIQASDLSVAVQVNNGRTLIQNLVPEGSGLPDPKLIKGEIVRVVTPNLVTPPTSNWMTMIGKNVLFTGLSLPGSKHSYTGDLYSRDAASINVETEYMDFYQSLYVADGVDTQFDRGIRAFDLKLIYEKSRYGNNMYVYCGDEKLTNNNYQDGMTIEQVLSNLNKKIQATKTKLPDEEEEMPSECAVVCLNYVSNTGYTANEWCSDLVAKIEAWNSSNGNVLTLLTPQTTMHDMRGHMAVIINVPQGMTPASSSVINYISTYGAGMGNTTMQIMKMNNQFDVHMQNLYQVNNPTITTAEGNWGIYSGVGLVPCYATKSDFTLGKDLIKVKEDLMNELLEEAKKDEADCLYINDLSGFCVVKESKSVGFQQAKFRTRKKTPTDWGREYWDPEIIFGDHNYDYYYDFSKLPEATYVQSNEPSAEVGETWLDMGEDQSYWGQGGNTAEFAARFNPIALNAIYDMVNTGRVPLGLVFMNFVGVETVTAGNDNKVYNVYGDRLPSLVMSNNFMFPLETLSNN